jgi:hypothetical protein
LNRKCESIRSLSLPASTGLSGAITYLLWKSLQLGCKRMNLNPKLTLSIHVLLFDRIFVTSPSLHPVTQSKSLLFSFSTLFVGNVSLLMLSWEIKNWNVSNSLLIWAIIKVNEHKQKWHRICTDGYPTPCFQIKRPSKAPR